jgi:hypothetical protein
MLTTQSSARYLLVIGPLKKKGFWEMTTVRRILAAAAVAGALAVLPISVIANDNQQARGVVSGTTIGGATTNGSGNWPFGR